MLKNFSPKRLLSFLMTLLMILLTMAKGDPAGTEVVINENAQNPYINEYGKPDISAHRSGAGIAPQNTLMAFEACVESEDFEIDIFEFDLQITKDGELVLLHDQTYDATSNAEEYFGKSDIRPRDYTFEELHQNLNLGAKFKGGETEYSEKRGEEIPDNLRVVRCENVLDYTEANSNPEDPFHYIIEIKSPLHWGQKAADKLYQILAERGLLNRTIVGTFWPGVASYLDKSYPEINRSAGIFECLQFYYYCRAGLDLNDLNIKYSVLQLPYGANVMPWRLEIINLGTRQVINYAHKYDIAVQYWTVNTAEDMEYLKENGADAIMTDWPGLACETYGR